MQTETYKIQIEKTKYFVWRTFTVWKRAQESAYLHSCSISYFSSWAYLLVLKPSIYIQGGLHEIQGERILMGNSQSSNFMHKRGKFYAYFLENSFQRNQIWWKIKWNVSFAQKKKVIHPSSNALETRLLTCTPLMC